MNPNLYADNWKKSFESLCLCKINESKDRDAMLDKNQKRSQGTNHVKKTCWSEKRVGDLIYDYVTEQRLSLILNISRLIVVSRFCNVENIYDLIWGNLKTMEYIVLLFERRCYDTESI